jgi:hypothetical protein
MLALCVMYVKYMKSEKGLCERSQPRNGTAALQWPLWAPLYTYIYKYKCYAVGQWRNGSYILSYRLSFSYAD